VRSLNLEEPMILLTDFGIAKNLSIESTIMTPNLAGNLSSDDINYHPLLGTPFYNAPEVVRGEKATKKSDVFRLFGFTIEI
jgi:serine/threonine protein kinase